ncbi:MAG: hypothetical protein HY447_03810 [Candidatus Omnitrophica bacterium]|nr:hypothetical protein [Candidatus Omnitrophota bacterium]
MDKKKRIFLVTAALLSFAFIITGCAELEKMLVRKKKSEPVKPLINVESTERPYAQLYKEHFIYWKGWHGETLKDLNGNPKRLQNDLREEKRHLTYLEKYLQPEKKEIVRSYVKEFDEIASQIQRESLYAAQANRGIIERQLESLGLRISNSLSYKDMKNFLLPTPIPFNLSEYEGEEPEVLPPAVKVSSAPADNLNK